MIRVHLGRAKEKKPLRPLTEKEIQDKLYGLYQEGNSPRVEAPEEFQEPPQPLKPKRIVLPSGSPKKKTAFSIPWRAILGLFSGMIQGAGRGLEGLWRFFQGGFTKIGTGWGLGIAVVLLLLLAVSTLNDFRAKAMREPPPVSSTLPSPDWIKSLQKAAAGGEEAARPEPIGWPVAVAIPTSPEPPRVETPVPPEVIKKPYVVQVCIYARKEDAERLVQQMTQEKFTAFYQPIRRSNSKMFHPVFLGRFKTFQEAQAQLEEFRKHPLSQSFPDSFVRSL